MQRSRSPSPARVQEMRERERYIERYRNEMGTNTQTWLTLDFATTTYFLLIFVPIIQIVIHTCIKWFTIPQGFLYVMVLSEGAFRDGWVLSLCNIYFSHFPSSWVVLEWSCTWLKNLFKVVPGFCCKILHRYKFHKTLTFLSKNVQATMTFAIEPSVQNDLRLFPVPRPPGNI